MFIDPTFIPYTALLTLLVLFILGRNLFKSDSPNGRILVLIAALLPFLYFYFFLFKHIVDIPYHDDYNLLDSFIRLLQASSWREGISVLFEQVNQHRFAFERTVMWLLYSLSGDFSVKTHILVGNTALIGITWLFYRYFATKSYPLYYFLPIPLGIFSLVFYENATWSIAALQNTPILFFALLTSYLVAKPNRFGWAFLCAIITTFISGNGVSIWIVGAIILLLQEKYSNLIKWTIIAAAVISFYFLFDYQFFSSEGTSLLSAPISNFIMASAFWGNLFYGDFSHLATRTAYPDLLLCVLYGILLLLVSLGFIFKHIINHRYTRKPESWILVGAMLFVLATGCMLVISRPTSWNVIRGGDFFSRRYMIFGVVLAVAGYLALLDFLENRKNLMAWFANSMLIFALVGHLVTYYFFAPKVITTQQELALDGLYIKQHGTLLSVGETYGEKPFWNHPHTFLNLIKRADSLALFTHPSTTPFEELLKEPVQKSETIRQLRLWSKQGLAAKLLGGTSSTQTLLLETNELVEEGTLYYLFKSPTHQFIVPAVRQNIPVERVSDLGKQAYQYHFRTEKFPAGTYQIAVATTAYPKGPFQVYDTGRSIILTP